MMEADDNVTGFTARALRVEGLGFLGYLGSLVHLEDLGFRVFRVWGLGFRV